MKGENLMYGEGVGLGFIVWELESAYSFFFFFFFFFSRAISGARFVKAPSCKPLGASW